MNSEQQIYDFHEQLEIGKKGEAHLDQTFCHEYHIQKVSKETEIKFGFDRVYHEPFGESKIKFTVEYKTDCKAHDTGNFFIETEIMSEGKISPGWALKSLAQYFFLFVPQDGRLLILCATTLKQNLGRLSDACGQRCCRNDGYNGKGLLVPGDTLRNLANCKLLNIAPMNIKKPVDYSAGVV